MTCRPNILWISTHDINPDLGAYSGVWPGAEYARTPHLDALAATGVRFDNAFAAAPICAPARSAIMTGCLPTAIGTMHMRTKAVPPPEVHLLPEYFRRAGYFTTNNWFTDFQVQTPPVVFDTFGADAHWRDRPDDGTPFFAMFHGMTTHESRIYLEDEEFLALTAHVADEDRHDPATAPLPPYHPDTPAFRTAWARYADLVTEMDHEVGELLAQLESDGLRESTIVVFWSDHGKGMPRAKRWPNESGLREPLIVSWPGHLAPGTRTDLVHTMDLAPTMLAMAGLPVPQHMHGRPFLDAEGRPGDDPRDYVVSGTDRQDEAEDRSRTVRDHRFRYIRHFFPDRPAMLHTSYPDALATWSDLRGAIAAEARQLAQGVAPSILTDLQRGVAAQWRPSEELYDIESDVHETTNLAEDPRYRGDLERMRAALDDWLMRYPDLGELPESELLERWRPGGVAQTTAVPEVALVEGRLRVTCATPGATIGWTTTRPASTPEPAAFDRVIGLPVDDGRAWRLYGTETPIPPDAEVWLRAWRLGFEPSAEVRWDAAAGAAAA